MENKCLVFQVLLTAEGFGALSLNRMRGMVATHGPVTLSALPGASQVLFSALSYQS